MKVFIAIDIDTLLFQRQGEDMDTNNQHEAISRERYSVVKNKQKAAIPRSTPASVLAAAPGTPEGGSALSWFSQATVILALIPFVGYLVSYAFQVKYFAYFGIPYYFVSLIPDLVFYTSFIWVLMGPVI